MKLIENNDFTMQGTCVAFGEFDGVHMGHRAVIDRLLGLSKQGMISVLLSFAYSESYLQSKKILTTPEEEKYLLRKNGPDVLISYKIDKPDNDVKGFIKEVVLGKLGAKTIVTGANNNNIQVLRDCSEEFGYKLEEVDAVLCDGEPVSAERIIKELSEGTIEKANGMLGYPYLIMGKVMHGKELGRTVGMPTANIGHKPYKQLPADGVFGTVSEVEGKLIKGLANLGRRPTVDNFDTVTVEAFFLDFSGDIYGQIITLELHAHIRGIRKFKNLAEVKLQVTRDIESVRSYFDQL